MYGRYYPYHGYLYPMKFTLSRHPVMHGRWHPLCAFCSPLVINLEMMDRLWRCQSILRSLGRDYVALTQQYLTRGRQREKKPGIKEWQFLILHFLYVIYIFWAPRDWRGLRPMSTGLWLWISENQPLALVKIPCRHLALLWRASDRYHKVSRLRWDYKTRHGRNSFVPPAVKMTDFYLLCWILRLNEDIHPKGFRDKLLAHTTL